MYDFIATFVDSTYTALSEVKTRPDGTKFQLIIEYQNALYSYRVSKREINFNDYELMICQHAY
jgi:hypothetical protein